MSSDHDWQYPGARWWKFDLHTHTPASRDTYWHRRQGCADRLTAEQWLQRFTASGIDCVAITDHNSGAWVDELKAAYETMRSIGVTTFRELHLFPGVEISVNSGFHLLAVFGPDKNTSDVDTLLGAIDYRSAKGDSGGVTHKSAIEVVEAVLNAGAVPIPAHVEADKGLLRVIDDGSRRPVLDANTIRQLLANPNISAMEVVDRTVPKAALYDVAKVDWCEVLGSDCHSFRGAKIPGTRFTWVKMETPSLEGLRLALMDGARFSIRRSDEPQPVTLPEHFVEAVEIANARFMGRGQVARRDELVVELQDVERKLKRFEDAGHTTVLTTYRRRSRQRREADRQFDATAAAAESIESAAESLHPDDLPDRLFDGDSAEDREAAAMLAKLADAARAAIRELHTSASRLRDAVQRLRSELAGSSWQVAIDEAVDRYDRLVDTLREEGVSDPSEYGHLAQDRQRIDGELADLDSLQEEQNRLREESQALLRRVLEARRAVSAAREDFLATALTGNRFVRIRNCPYNDDPTAIEISLREELGVTNDRFRDDFAGAASKLLRNLAEEPAQRNTTVEARIEQLKARIRRACDGGGDFGGHFNNYLERESERTPKFPDRALAWFPKDGLQVEYSRIGDGMNFEPINQASAGQRSAAMLAFLLAHGDEPLVLDQPEGDLDNHLIYDLIVRQIREQKLKRQIIVVTHNPNLVVNGDAEMVHVLDFHGQCYVKQRDRSRGMPCARRSAA